MTVLVVVVIGVDRTHTQTVPPQVSHTTTTTTHIPACLRTPINHPAFLCPACLAAILQQARYPQQITPGFHPQWQLHMSNTNKDANSSLRMKSVPSHSLTFVKLRPVPVHFIGHPTAALESRHSHHWQHCAYHRTTARRVTLAPASGRSHSRHVWSHPFLK